MQNNKLIKYSENVFTRMLNFFKKFFSKEDILDNENRTKESVVDNKNEIDFTGVIQLKENEEEIRLKKLQLLYDNNEIDEEDLSETDIEKLIILYENETEKLNKDTLRRKVYIEQMLKDLKD